MIIDFGDLQVFKGATTYPCIIRITKSTPHTSFEVTQVKTLEFQNLDDYVKENHYSVNQLTLDDSGWSLTDESTQALLDKLKGTGVPLGEYVHGKIYYGIKTGLNEAFVIDAKTREKLITEDPKSLELIKSFLAGRDIARYQQPESDKYLIFTRHGVNINDYPAIKQYLSQFKDRLMPKPKDWKDKEWNGRKPGAYQWYEVQDTIDYHAEFEKPKIFWPEIAGSARFTFDDSGYYANNKTYLIPIFDLYLLGLLNSAPLRLFIHSVSTDLQGDSFNFSAIFIERTPIHTIDFSDPADATRHDRMVSLHLSLLPPGLKACLLSFSLEALGYGPGLAFLLLHHGSTCLGIQRETLQLQLDNRGKSPKLQLCYMLQLILLEQLQEDIMEGKDILEGPIYHLQNCHHPFFLASSWPGLMAS